MAHSIQVIIPPELAQVLQFDKNYSILGSIEQQCQCHFDTSSLAMWSNTDTPVQFIIRASNNSNLDGAYQKLLQVPVRQPQPDMTHRTVIVLQKSTASNMKIGYWEHKMSAFTKAMEDQAIVEWLNARETSEVLQISAINDRLLNVVCSELFHLIRECESDLRSNKRYESIVIIDADNVCMEHGGHRFYSARGLKIAIEYFREKNHQVKTIIPRARLRGIGPRRLQINAEEVAILKRLEADITGVLVVVEENRRATDRAVVRPYDDRIVIEYSALSGGVIISNDNFSDMAAEKPEWAAVIDERRFKYKFIGDVFIPIHDSNGRNRTLEMLLNGQC